jgi:hypothetical protein
LHTNLRLRHLILFLPTKITVIFRLIVGIRISSSVNFDSSSEIWRGRG